MFKVIISAYTTAKHWNPRNLVVLEKIYQAIFGYQQKLEPIPNYSTKQRLKMAIEQLAFPNGEVSLTVFNDLAQIAEENPKYHGKIRESLANFIRYNAPNQLEVEVNDKQLLTIRADIQAALTIIAKRNPQPDLEAKQIDLSHIDIRGANLSGANLEQTNLYQTNLSGADLCSANLQGAILTAANLSGANLAGANLKEAILSAANLSGANLTGANLYRANLYLAKLDGAILNDAILDGANLKGVKFGDEGDVVRLRGS